MTIYVDDMRAPYGRLVMCHMIADSDSELLGMATTIGVPLQHIQHRGTAREHFDICLSKRALAIKAGAVPITLRQLARMCQYRRQHGVLPKPEDVAS